MLLALSSFIELICLGFANFNAHGVLLYINFDIAGLNARTRIHAIFNPVVVMDFRSIPHHAMSMHAHKAAPFRVVGMRGA